MADTKAPNNIVLFHYPFSPFGRRVAAYLALRGLAYAECVQPIVMPRPDLAELGVRYRRIPVLAVGRDVYLDTRLIIRKLEALFPAGRLGSDDPQDQFVTQLLSRYVVESPVFWAVSGLVPKEMLGDPTFAKDRAGFCGRSWSVEEMAEGRGECLEYVRGLFAFLETTVLSDGREWVLGGKRASLADIEAIWPLDWLFDLNGSMPEEIVSERLFPKVYAWIHRYRAALEQAKSSAPKVVSLGGQEAVRSILESDYAQPNMAVAANDPQDLKQGAEIEVYPADWGHEHRDRGLLVSLGPDEVTLQTTSKAGETIRIHAPRTGFKVTEVGRNGQKESGTQH